MMTMMMAWRWMTMRLKRDTNEINRINRMNGMEWKGTEYHFFGAGRLVGVAIAEMTYVIIGEAVIGKFCDRRAPNLVRTNWVDVICANFGPKHDFNMQSLPVGILARIVLSVANGVFYNNNRAHI